MFSKYFDKKTAITVGVVLTLWIVAEKHVRALLTRAGVSQ